MMDLCVIIASATDVSGLIFYGGQVGNGLIRDAKIFSCHAALKSVSIKDRC